MTHTSGWTVKSAAACLAGFAIGCSHRPAEPSPEGASNASIQRYTTVKPVRTRLRRTTAQPGRIEAFEETPIVARVPGYVEKVAVDIGQRVRDSEVLLELSAPELADEVRQRAAELKKAQADATQAKASQAAAEAKILTAEAAVREAEAGIDRAQSEYLRAGDELKRVEQLTQSNAVTHKLLDETLHSHRSADAGRKEAAAKVASTKALLAEARALAQKAKADVDGAAARVGVAEANLQLAKTMAQYTVIHSPYDGVVSSRRVHTGHFVGGASAAASPLLVLQRTNPARIVVEIPESEAALVRPGEEVVIHVSALPKAKFVGRVTRTSHALNPNNRTLRVEIDVPNPSGQLIPGMYVNAVVTIADRNNVLAIPQAAVLKGPDGAEDCFVIEAGKLVKRRVETGVSVDDLVEIASGLQGDEEVVKSAVSTLIDGSPAAPNPTPPSAR